MTDIATLQARLAEAEDALHRLSIGAQEVQVGYDGKSATFSKADEGKLRAYIAELKQKINPAARRHARRPFFGR